MGAIRKYDPPDAELRELVEKARRRTSEQSTLDFAVDCVRLGYRAGRAEPRPAVELASSSGPTAPHKFVNCGCGNRSCAYCNNGLCLACGKGEPAERHQPGAASISPPPPTENARPCAAIIDGEPCGEPETEPPHGKMRGHKYVAPTENARVGADEAVTLEDNRVVVRLCECYPDINALPGPVLDGLAQAIANSRAAGRARGIEDGKRAESDRWVANLKAAQQLGADVGWLIESITAPCGQKCGKQSRDVTCILPQGHSGYCSCRAIADAIAKED